MNGSRLSSCLLVTAIVTMTILIGFPRASAAHSGHGHADEEPLGNGLLDFIADNILGILGGLTGISIISTVMTGRSMPRDRKRYFRIHRVFGYSSLTLGLIHGTLAFVLHYIL